MKRIQALVYCFLFCSLTFKGILGFHDLSEEEELSEYDVKFANFTKEIIENFRGHLSDGIPEFGIPSFDPFLVPNIDHEFESGQYRMSLRFRHVNMTGMSKLKPAGWMEARLDKDVVEFKILVPEITFQGHCYMDGKIMDYTDASGDGPFSIRLREVLISGSGHLDYPTGNGGTRPLMKNLELVLWLPDSREYDFKFLEKSDSFFARWKVEKEVTEKLGQIIFYRYEDGVMIEFNKALLKFINNEFGKRTLSELLD